ncbi:MAG: alpha/beta hydrolase [Anaerolineales bacterium]
MKFIRLLGDLILAVLLAVVCTTIMLLAYGCAMVGSWEVASASAEGGAFALVEGQPIYYRTWGPEDGAPLVLVHGLEVGGSALWDPIAAPLGRAGYRVIAVDLRAMGNSSRETTQDLSVEGQANAVIGVLSQLDVQGAAVVAQGWGSMVAVQAALDMPERVQSLVLIGPERELGLNRYELLLAKMPFARNAVAWLVRSGGPVWNRLVHHQVANASAELERYLREAKAASQIEGTAKAFAALYTLDPTRSSPAAIGSLTTPCLIVYGSEDRLVSAEQVASLAEETQADVRTIEGAGHLVVLDQPEILRKVIVEALQP